MLNLLEYVAQPIDLESLSFAWSKTRSRYEMNALENESYKDSYCVTVEKAERSWIVYAEEHEPGDLECPEEGFSTLKAAKAFAEDFARFYQATQWESQREAD